METLTRPQILIAEDFPRTVPFAQKAVYHGAQDGRAEEEHKRFTGTRTARPDGRLIYRKVHTMNAHKNFEPKRQGMFNPPFKYTQTCELNNCERLEQQSDDCP